jgi:hypothetical protein
MYTLFLQISGSKIRSADQDKISRSGHGKNLSSNLLTRTTTVTGGFTAVKITIAGAQEQEQANQ